MGSRLALAARIAVAASACSLPAHASEPPASSSATATTEVARAHFKTGVKLYQVQNYEGALSEFEAAYAVKPGPGSLQNVALCQKALLRYGEAIDSLSRLLERHGRELSDAERSAAERAMSELDALVGRIRLEVSPTNAALTVDGRPLTHADRTLSVRLNTGEHALVASAPGYAPLNRTLSVTSSKEEVVVSVALVPTAGFLDVSSPDREASIAIDGKPVAYGHYFGPVTPGEPHLVQIYKAGAAPFESRVSAELGKTVVISNAPVPSGVAPPPAPPSAGSPAPARDLRSIGWYAMGSVGVSVASAPPFRFDLSDASSHMFGVGLRGGRRIRAPVALEGLLAYSALHVDGACDTRRGEVSTPPIACGTPEAAALDVSYTLRSVRFGPTLALMTTHPRVRALGGLGLGLVWHELRCEGCIAGQEQKSHGVDGYFLVELGVGANVRHLVMALALQTIIDGTKNMISDRNLGTGAATLEEDAYARSHHAVAYFGLDLRLGFSEWAP